MSGMEWFTQRPGGLSRYLMDFSNAWVSAGHQARVLVRVQREIGKDTTNDLPSFVRPVLETTRNPYRVRAVWHKAFQDEIRGGEFEIFNPHFAYYAWGWGNAFEIPVVTHFHGPWAYESLAERGRGRRLTGKIPFLLQRTIERRTYAMSDQFIVLSEAFRHQLHQLYGVPDERIHVVPGAVDTDRFIETVNRDAVRDRLGLPRDRFVLLAVRRLARRMGLENLIQAVSQLTKEFPDVYLVVAGDGGLRSTLELQVQELGIERSVRFVGRVPEDELPLYYQSADLSVVPSVALEGFGLATVESMACGTPVAGTPVGGTREILEAFCPALLFEGTSSADVAHGLRRLLCNTSQLPGRASTRQHVLERYTWDSVVPRVNKVFEIALKPR